jgi:hypothetical protein
LVVERGLEARGYVLHFCIRRLGNGPLRPWLRSVAALRLNKDAAFAATFVTTLSIDDT